MTVNIGEMIAETGIDLIREGTSNDAVLGAVPGVVAAPGSVEGISRLLSWANERGLAVIPCGTRTKLDRGTPPARYDILLDLSRLSGVIEHAAGDLTVTVRAGTRLDDLQAELAKAGQFLAVDPPVPGTVGGLIACGDSGPRRFRYGGVRDLLLGVSFVRADGTLARGGGKVVKNVAGYDLPKLFTGALGTLGVIVEATFRLYPLPSVSATAVVSGVSERAAADALSAIVTSSVTPTVLDYYAAAGESHFAVRFEGTDLPVWVQAARTVELLGKGARVLSGEDENALWRLFSGVMQTEEGDVLARLSSVRSDLPALLKRARAETNESGVELSLRAHVGHAQALLRWHEPSTEAALPLLTSLRAQAEACSSRLVVWRTPADVRERFEVWGSMGESLDLMRRVKAQFDPRNTLNPGRFVGGI